ncbi:5R [Xanthomonas phage Xp10]|uniref:5R n=1 Tax=Xanthomonas phage Xp10 TaxID=2907956 RepID=Q7Y5L2_9CAUD|nr:predicted DNA-binding module [Xanthomonas phage Xp10]AAP58672.1 5R [Xanthomonas phage Xp10]
MIDYSELTFEQVAEKYSYDPETGIMHSKFDGTSEYLGIYETLEQMAARAEAKANYPTFHPVGRGSDQ